MVVALDVGTPKDVHPRNKRPVGERLAGLALRDLYGRQDLVAEGPIALSAQHSGQTLRIRFRSAGGLKFSGETTPLIEVRTANSSEFQALRGAHVEGETVVVEAAGRIVEVRYAWHMNAVAALRNGADLPAGPFVLKVSE